MKKYLLNSAVITSEGVYSYRIINLDKAKEWLKDYDWISTIGYEQTALALKEITGIQIPVVRKTIMMKVDDEALVFRLVFPPGTKRIDPKQKGKLSKKFILNNCEIGLLKRIK